MQVQFEGRNNTSGCNVVTLEITRNMLMIALNQPTCNSAVLYSWVIVDDTFQQVSLHVQALLVRSNN